MGVGACFGASGGIPTVIYDAKVKIIFQNAKALCARVREGLRVKQWKFK